MPFADRAILSPRVIELCDRAGVKGLAHCFRDTFACDMLTRGIGVFEVAKMLADTVETVARASVLKSRIKNRGAAGREGRGDSRLGCLKVRRLVRRPSGS